MNEAIPALYDNFYPEDISGEPVVLISHYDLDAVGATYFALKLFNVVAKSCSGYAKMLDKLKSQIGKAKNVVFVDVSASDEIMQCALDNFEKIYYADHHLDSERFAEYVEKYPGRFFYLFDHDQSATRLVANKCDRSQFSGAEIQFEAMTNAYDLWQTDSKWFKFGYHLNTLFWDKHFHRFLGFLKKFPERASLQDCLHADEIQLCKDKKQEVIDYLTDENNFERIEEGNTTALLYFFPTDKFYINDVLLEFDDVDLAFGVTVGTKLGSIRTTLETVDLNDVIKSIDSLEGGGHRKACGVTFESEDPDVVIDGAIQVIERVIELRGE